MQEATKLGDKKINDDLLANIFGSERRYWLVCGFLAMGVGMTLLLYGLALGDAGVVTTLAATQPVLILPLLWISTGKSPPLMAWVSAVLTLIGLALITFSWG